VLPGTRGAVHCVRGYIALNRGQYDDTVRHATASWTDLRNTGENTRLSQALTCRGHGHRRLGRLVEAREDYVDAMAAARRAGNEHELGLCASNLGFLLWQTGRFLEARDLHRKAVEIHERCGSDAHVSRELFALAVDEFHAGDWRQAEALLDRCGERAERTQDRRLASAVAIQRGRIAHCRGEDTRPALAEACRLAESAGLAHDRIVIGQILGDAALERGDWSEAKRILDGTLALARESSPEGEPVADTAWRLALAEDALGDPDGRALDLLSTALDILAGRDCRFPEAMARRALGVVLSRRDRMDEAREHLEFAVEVFDELSMPFEAARSRGALATLVAESATGAALAVPLFREAENVLRGLGAVRDAERCAKGLAAASGDGVSGRASGVSSDEPFAEIVTVAATMEGAIERARRIAPSDIPVLVTGETGTGKELFARSIHRASQRAAQPFLAVNCAALTETLLEAELFGHVKGAFTGATSGREGIFEAANGGTVFLDEIGKAPVTLQSKLLRVLDTGEVRRVGGVESIHVDVRIVAATNRSIPDLVDAGEFLPDLFYRLRGFEIDVPPLRDRKEDVRLVFERFAGRPASEAALEVLEIHDWPGNVRELRNLAESAAFLAFGRGPIPLDALPDWIREAARRPRPRIASLEETERRAVLRALDDAGGNRSRAARALGVSRQTLYTKMAKHGIGAETAPRSGAVSGAAA
jgi:DNA-binding NtrC family response regulator/tetratricopeptide (TPR) repeat protein